METIFSLNFIPYEDNMTFLSMEQKCIIGIQMVTFVFNPTVTNFENPNREV